MKKLRKQSRLGYQVIILLSEIKYNSGGNYDNDELLFLILTYIEML